ncbi:uncharacterized protein LOC118646570 [Monomorium pharaonis]|uniref:uncharacterized protein LOC118646570 n=1 Tax=Monomorium pharaonis TaxID=307658 RepID=UPI0017478CA6|nr:uncharacterized protein LOC118646570 [Monomorium pharaonis]
MAEEIRILVQKRSVIKAKLTRFRTYLDSYTARPDIQQLRERLAKVRELWDKFDDIQTDIELLEPDGEFEERSEFEQYYFELVSKAEQHCVSSTVTRPTSNDNIDTNVRRSERTVKLPTINLPNFDGDYNAWLCFYDNFKTTIHDNSDLKPVQKLQYLKSCLKGDAAQIIESLATSAENYEIAWNLVVERFDNKRIIIQNHVRSLFELPNIAKESLTGLRALMDGALRHLRALKTLGLQTEHWDAMLIQLIIFKVDRNTHKEWERSIDGTEMPSLEDLWKFLKNKCYVLENVDAGFASQSKVSGKLPLMRDARNSNVRQSQNCMTVQERQQCPICNGSHNVYKCEQLLRANCDERISLVKTARLCFNCLRPNHSANFCRFRPCSKCRRRHNDLLHRSEIRAISNSEEKHENDIASQKSLQAVVASHIFLSTALVKIFDKFGNAYNCRILLDSGSQSNFIVNSLVEKLKLTKRKINVPVSGFGQALTHIEHAVDAEIQSSDGRLNLNLTFLAIDEITEYLPAKYIDKSKLEIPRNIRLADPEFCKPSRIDALIGAETFFHLLCVGQIRLSGGSIVLQKTKFGWIIGGRIYDRVRDDKETVCNISIDKTSLQVAKFWEIEELSDIKHLSEEERNCEAHFRKFTVRDEKGRYCVRLPFKGNVNKLGDSYKMAEKRLFSMERRLLSNEAQRAEYSRFLREYCELGHMIEVTNCNAEKLTDGYFLPHHAVLKTDSLTTKLRVVFDASARSTTGVALNDVLMSGPVLQEDVFSIVTRFRSYSYVLTADIEKMFRQVRLHLEDTKYQRILWRENPMESIRMYGLQTVIYGTRPGNYLAVRCLHQLAMDEEDDFPLASEVLKRDFYVDDLLTGADNYERALQTN